MNKKTRIVLVCVVIVAVITFLMYQLIMPAAVVNPKQVSYAELIQAIHDDEIGAIYYQADQNIIYAMKKDSGFPIERILKSYDVWVEDSPGEKQLWLDVQQNLSEEAGYGFVMQFPSS